LRIWLWAGLWDQARAVGDEPPATDAALLLVAIRGANANRRLVFVIENGEDKPRPVLVGVSNLDYTQILDGLSETDSVDATPTSRLAADRQQFMDRMSRFSSVPGMKKATNTGK